MGRRYYGIKSLDIELFFADHGWFSIEGRLGGTSGQVFRWGILHRRLAW